MIVLHNHDDLLPIAYVLMYIYSGNEFYVLMSN